MSTPTVLIVTARTDYTADMVVAELGRRGVPVVRLDPADDEPVRLDVRLTASGWDGTVSQYGRTVALADVGGVFWRWAWAPPGHAAIQDPARRAWAAKEDQAALFGTLRTLPARWINHPDRATAANSKPVQLVVAERLGFPTPQTLITHSGTSAADWTTSKADPNRVLYKAFFCQGIDAGGMVPASPIDPEQIPEGELYAASMFQHLIHGQPIRTTVIGDTVFSVVITSNSGAIDWRPGQQSSTLHEVATPPETVARLHRFMAHFGLEYGAFDFIADKSGKWWFLEINPTGQYGFVEIKTGLGLTAALADRLCQPVESINATMSAMAE